MTSVKKHARSCASSLYVSAVALTAVARYARAPVIAARLRIVVVVGTVLSDPRDLL